MAKRGRKKKAAAPATEGAKTQYRRGRIGAPVLAQIKDDLAAGSSLDSAIAKHADKNGLTFNPASVQAALDGKKPAKVKPAATGKRRGRPPGSKNAATNAKKVGRPAGRPKGAGSGLSEIERIVQQEVSRRMVAARDAAIKAISAALA